MNKSIRNITIGAAATASLLMASQTFALTESVVAEVEFVAPITMVETNALQFGYISTDAIASNVISVDSAGATTDTNSLLMNNDQAAAAITVGATASKTIDIIVNNITDGTGYALSAFLCTYDGGTETNCSSTMSVTSVTSANLTIGATLTADGLDSAGAADGSFDVVITYQ